MINVRKTRSTVHGVRVHPDVIDLEVQIDSFTNTCTPETFLAKCAC